MDAYFERFGKVKAYLDAVVTQARRDGYTSTILGGAATCPTWPPTRGSGGRWPSGWPSTPPSRGRRPT